MTAPPTILAEYIDEDNVALEQIIEVDYVWCVFYKGRPFNYKVTTIANNAANYKKLAFNTRGNAVNLAQILNAKFNTDQFKVVRFTAGVIDD